MRKAARPRRRKLLRLLLVALALFVTLVLAGVAFLLFGDLGRFREPIERQVSTAIGRELKINGAFALDLLPSPRLVAEDVTLAGAEWSDEPFMARVGQLRLDVDLWSLLAPPVHVEELEIRGVRVRLERDAEGRANWDLGVEDHRAEAAAPGLREPSVLWERIRIEDVELLYHEPSRERPMRFAVDRLDAKLEEHGLFAVSLEGELDTAPVRVKGSITSLHRLLQGDPLVHDLDARVGRIELSVHGRVAEVAALQGIDFELSANGPDVATITEFFELPSLGSGPFQLNGNAGSTPGGVDLSLTADLVELQLDAHGQVDSLTDPRELELGWNVSGANLHAAGALIGWTRLPAGPFEASGRLSGDGARTTLDSLQARVGDHRVSVEGVLRAASSFVDRDLRFEMVGPDLSAFSSLAGARLPERPYGLKGQLVRSGERIEIARLAGKLGKIDLEATGTIDEDFRLARAELNFRITGPDLIAIEPLTGGVVPEGPFELAGHLETDPSRLLFRDVEGRVGDTALEIDGKLALAEGLVGTDLRLRVAGPDPFWLTPLLGSARLPVEPYEVGGRVLIRKDGYDLRAVAGSYGSVTLDLDGRLGMPPSFESSDLQIRISGNDLSWLASLGGVDGLPSDPFDLAGRVRKRGVGYELDTLRVSAGDIDVVASGILGELPRIEGSDLKFDIHGPDLSALSRYPEVPSLPEERFNVSGRVKAEPGTYQLEQISGELGRHRFAVDGALAQGAGFLGSEFDLQLSGPDLEDAARIARVSGLPELPSLPEAEYSLDGRVLVGESGYQIERLIARVADAEARIEGKLGQFPRALGTDLSIAARGSDASILPAIEDKPLPQQPFSLDGRVERVETGVRFHGFEIELGEHRATIDGLLGDPPRLEATDLDLRVEGPDLSVLDDHVDWPLPADGPLELAAHFEGSPEHFAMRDLHARLGESDVDGSFELDLRGDRPHLRGDFSSEQLELVELVDEGDSDDRDEDPGLLLSDEPFELEWLNRLNAEVRWKAGQVTHRRGTLRGIELGLRITEGRLRLDRARAAGQDGTYTIELDVAPIEDGYRVEVHGQAEQARLSLFPFSGDPSEIAPMDLEFQLIGAGRSVHSIAASANGRIRVVQGSGKIDNSALTQMGADVLSKLYGVLNPFMKEEQFTALECSVFLVEVEDGVARLGPLAMRTDKAVTVGGGTVDLRTEELSLHWATKPRKGVGLSASAITNNYIKLGGSLSEPQLNMSPLKAARATGAAVFTGGLSVLGRAVFNRVSAERNVCRRALAIETKREKKGKRRRK